MTKKEKQAEIQYCYALNDHIRGRFLSTLSGFITGLIVMSIFIPAGIFMCFKCIESHTQVGFIALGITVGCIVAALVLAIVSIYEIVSCKKELKKCDEMDVTLQEQWQALELEYDGIDEERDISA